MFVGKSSIGIHVSSRCITSINSFVIECNLNVFLFFKLSIIAFDLFSNLKREKPNCVVRRIDFRDELIYFRKIPVDHWQNFLLILCSHFGSRRNEKRIADFLVKTDQLIQVSAWRSQSFLLTRWHTCRRDRHSVEYWQPSY
jgi:hypothetical protein